MSNLNPFLYGKPVPPNRLFGRRNVAQTVFSRLANGESTAIVGEPHIGKSSVLRFIADENVRGERLGAISAQHLFMDIDCHLMPADFQPADFWRRVIETTQDAIANDALKKQCAIIAERKFDSFALEGLFKQLAKLEWRIVLLIDEFESLLNHPNFNRAEFFGALRSFATRTDALVVITASRTSVAQMNRKSQEINPHGSPFFNNVTEVRVLPLNPGDAEQLLTLTLQMAKNGITFSEDDRTFLSSLVGRHPYLLQMAGASLFDATSEIKSGEARYLLATRMFNERAAAHFDDFWRHLVASEQRALLLLALAQFRGYTDGRSFDLRQIGKLDWYGPDLRQLRDMGIVESESAPGAVSWMGENWRIAAGGVVPWLMDNIVSGTRDAKDFSAWLHDKEYQGLFTNEEVAKIKTVASKIPKGAVDMAAEFVKGLFKIK